MEIKPGVGYQVVPGSTSKAGVGHGHLPVQMDLSIDPWKDLDPYSPNVDPALMSKRYGPHWQSGAGPGPHSNVYQTTMEEQFRDKVASWPIDDYSLWNGKPTRREVTDAYYSKDSRILGVAKDKPSRKPPRKPAEPPVQPTIEPPIIEPPTITPTTTPITTIPPLLSDPATRADEIWSVARPLVILIITSVRNWMGRIKDSL